MVGRCDHQYAVIILQTVDLVEEVTPCVLCHDRIDIFHHQHAWNHGSRHLEHGSDVVAVWCRLHVESDDRGLAIVKRVHQCLQRDGLAVSNRAVENDAPL